ncbi:MAG: M28 family peptidase [Atopobiaceae bacterium]
MSKTHEYLNYLDEQIGIAPANSQEELQAAQTISEVMADHGVNPEIEEFSTPTGAATAKSVVTLIMLLALIFAGFGSILGFVGVVVAIACAVLLLMIHAGRTPFAKMGPVVQSQNVVAFHAQTGSKVVKGNRPIVIIAHYDTPRVNPLMNNRGMARFYARAYGIRVYCLYGVAIASFVQLLGFLPPVVRRIFWFLGILAALVPAIIAISDIATRFGDCTDGANDNKASVAAMLSILNNVRPGADVALDAEAVKAQQEEEERAREEARRAREEEEAAAAAAEAEAKAKAEAERLARYKRHGKETLESLGMLPAGCPIVYEDPHVDLEPKEEPAEQPASAEPEAAAEPAPQEAAPDVVPAAEEAPAAPEPQEAQAEEKPLDKTMKKPSIGSLFSRVRHTLESDEGYDDEEPAPSADEDAADKTLVRPKENEAPAAEAAPETEEPEDDEATTTFEKLPEDLGETPAQAPVDTENVYKPAESEESPYQGQSFADRQKRLWPKVMDAEWEPIDTVTPAGMAPDEPPSAATSVGEPRPRSEAAAGTEKKDEEEGESGDSDVPLAESESEAVQAPDEPEAPEMQAAAPVEEQPAPAPEYVPEEEPSASAPEEAAPEAPASAADAEESPVPAAAETEAAPAPEMDREPFEPAPEPEPAEAAAPAEPEPAEPAAPEAPAVPEETAAPAPAPAAPHTDEAEYLAHRSEDIASYVDSIFAEEINAAKDLGTEHVPEPAAGSAPAEPEPESHKPGPDDSAVMAALASLDTMPQAKDYAPANEEEAPAPRKPGKHLAGITPVVELADIEDVSSPEEEGPVAPAADEEEEPPAPESAEPASVSWEADPFAHISKSTPVDAVFEEIEEPEEETPAAPAEEEQPEEPEEVPAAEAEPSEPEQTPEPASAAAEPEAVSEPAAPVAEPVQDEPQPAEPEEPTASEPEPAPAEEEPAETDAVEDAGTYREPVSEGEEESPAPEEAPLDETAPDMQPADASVTDEAPSEAQAEEMPSAPAEEAPAPAPRRPLYPSVMDAEAIEEIEEEPEPEPEPEPEEPEADVAPEPEPEPAPKPSAEEETEPEPEPEPEPAYELTPTEPEPAPVEEPEPAAEPEEEAAPAEEPVPVEEIPAAAEPAFVPEPEEDAPAAVAEPEPEEEAAEEASSEEAPEPASEDAADDTEAEPAEEAPAEQPSEDEQQAEPVVPPENFHLDMDDMAPDDPEIAPKDLTGVVAEAEDMEEPEPEPREKPAMPDDPEWGKTSFKPAISQMARRVILNDLPDPSQHSIDPFGSESISSQPMQIPEGQQSMPKKPEQGTFDVITPETLDRIAKETHQEKKHHHFGRHGGKGRHFAETPSAEDCDMAIHARSTARPHHGSNSGWKGGATPKDELRLPKLDLADDGPESHGYELDPEKADAIRAQAAAETAAQAKAEAEAQAAAAAQEAEARSQQVSDEELRDAVLSMNDEDLISHDIWFVATGASELDHAGIKAFLDAHRQDIRGAFLIDLDCIGAGSPTVLVEEGHDNPKRADRRLVRMFQNIAQDFGIPLGRARYSIADTDATTALRRHIRSVTIMGMDENGLPAFSHTLDDVPENVDGDQVADIVEMVTELIRQS